MGDEKVLDRHDDPVFDGMFADVIGAIDRTRDIICTASQITDEKAKRALFDGAKIILENCIAAIDDRAKQDDTPVIEELDD